MEDDKRIDDDIGKSSLSTDIEQVTSLNDEHWHHDELLPIEPGKFIITIKSNLNTMTENILCAYFFFS